MTAICGVAGPAPPDVRDRTCRKSLEAQSLYSRRAARFSKVEGATFGAALFETTPEDFNDDQPLRLGGILLAADSRLDNRNELLAALADKNLTSDSADSAILLSGWNRWKAGLFERIVGSFAIAVFDSDSATLTLARGPLGDRPLCYRLEDRCFRFASMPSGLLDAPEFAGQLEALARFMVLGDMALGETPFAGVRSVLPGHYLQWSAKGERQVRFWHPPAVEPGTRNEVTEEFRSVLDEAVRCRLRRVGGPVATHLSGGLDSGATAATAARLLPDRRELIAFTMAPAPGLPLSVPRGYLADESSLASGAAQVLGIEQRTVAHSGPLLDCLEDHPRIYQAPVPNVPNHGWGYAIDRQASAAGARILLSTTQGNASLSYGSIDVLTEWLRRGRIVDYWRQVRALVRSGAARWRGALFYSVTDFLPRPLWTRLAGYLHETSEDFFIRREWFDKVKDDEIGSAYDSPGLRRNQYAMYAATDPGMFVKATLAKSGLDERDPGADRRLIEFCLRLPPECYLNDGMNRRLAREGLSDRLPSSIVRNNVRGYQGADWFAKLDPRDALQWIEEIDGSPAARDLVDVRGLRRAVDSWQKIAGLDPFRLRQWGCRFTRALAVGTFLRDVEREPARFGRRS